MPASSTASADRFISQTPVSSWNRGPGSLLSGLADARRAIGNLDEQVAGTLKLATSHHIGLHRLAPVLKQFSRQFRDVQLDIRFEDSEAAHDLVRRGDSELAVVTLNPAGDPDLATVALWDDSCVSWRHRIIR